MNAIRYVNCPRCGAQVAWTKENRYRPFCSERCKMIDLGDWAMEKFRVPVADNEDARETDQDPPLRSE